jgi:uncharacterized protein
MPSQDKEKKKVAVSKSAAKKTTGKATKKKSASTSSSKAKKTTPKTKSTATKKKVKPATKTKTTKKSSTAKRTVAKKTGTAAKKSTTTAKTKAATRAIAKKKAVATRKKAATTTAAKKKAAAARKKTSVTARKKATTTTAKKSVAKKATVATRAATKKAAKPKKKTALAKKSSVRKKGVIPIDKVAKPTETEAAASQTAFAPFRRNEPFEPTPEIPFGYGENELALMARDPEWAYAYWEITAETMEITRNRYGREVEGASMVLRVYDITDLDGAQAENGFYDITIFGGARDWFIHLQRPGGQYYCEIGLITISGRFIGLLKSNPISLPPRSASSVVDEKWMSGEEAFSRIFQLSGGLAEKTGSSFSERSYQVNVTEMLFSGTLQSRESGENDN